MGPVQRATALPQDVGHQLRAQWLRLSPWSRRWLPRGLAAVGFALLAKALLDQGIQGAGGRGGIDAAAYWTAAGNVRDGLPLYLIHEGEYTAYAYPPVLAQLLVPLSFLPLAAFVWVWRVLELLALRIATGSWTGAGLAILFVPPVIAEIDAGNVHLLMAGACALAMRGYAGVVAPATLLKFASVPLAPLGWVLDRRGLLLGAGVTAAAVGVSYVAAPTAWADYANFLRTTSFPTGWYNLAEYVPLPARLAAAVVFGLAATRWLRLAPVAVLLAYPVLWFHALSTLVAILGPIAPARRRAGAPTLDEAEGRGGVGTLVAESSS